MPYELNETHEVYTLNELESICRSGHSAALDRLFDEMNEAWWEWTYPDLVENFQHEHNEPNLVPEIDLERLISVARGFLRVPEAIALKWAEDGTDMIERVPVGEFHDWTGFLYKVGGERFAWIPDEDGVTLLERLNYLMDLFIELANESYEAITDVATLSAWANEDGLLFYVDGRRAGTTHDLSN